MDSPKSMVWWMIPVILGFFMGSIVLQIQTCVPSEVVTVNPDGATGTAFVAYHAGLSSFQKDVTMAFVRGLVSNGWRCDVTTASREAPMDLSAYDLLVLGAPTYAFKPANPLRRYLTLAGDLGGLPTVLLVTGAGTTENAASVLAGYVTDANGTTIDVLELWQAAPSEEVDGLSDAMEIAERAGESIVLP